MGQSIAVSLLLNFVIEKCFYKEVASLKEGIEVDTTNLEAIVVSVDEYIVRNK